MTTGPTCTAPAAIMRTSTFLNSRAGVAALLVAAGALAGCAGGAGGPTTSTIVVRTTTVTAAPSSEPTSQSQLKDTMASIPAPDIAAALTRLAADVEARTGAQVSLAVVPVDGTPAVQAGTLAGVQPAWSTIKVPLSIAALRADPSAEGTVRQAITASDNAAAEALWTMLGASDAAATAVGSILAAAGDTATVVNPEVTRPGFSAFGQTQWDTAAQASFARQLPTITGADQVLAAMGSIVAGQDYGLGQIPGTRFKGGWGPDESGRYLVRQFGLVAGTQGETGVALAVVPADGTYESGQAALTELALGLQGTLG